MTADFEHIVFVYGTLKRGFPNHYPFLDQALYVGEFETAQKYPLVIGSQWYIPFLLDEPGKGSQVKGEVYRVHSECLKALDKLEGVDEPGWYHRRKIQVRSLTDLSELQAEAYLIDRNKVNPVHEEGLSTYDDDRYVESIDREDKESA